MPLHYPTVRNWKFADKVQQVTTRDAILYALSVGYGQDPIDARQLRFVFERGLVCAPTLPLVLGYPGFWMQDPASGIDWVRALHAGQGLRLVAPVRLGSQVIGRTRVKAVIDKGPHRGALVVQERELMDAASGGLLAVIEQATLCRGDGGFGGGDAATPPPARMPHHVADYVVDLPTLPQSALLYRLCADPNPLHADPEVARAAGFQRPILHGLCTFGVAAHALLRTACDYDLSRLGELSARFSTAVYPGETLRTELWRCGNELEFRTRVLERDTIVLDHGRARIL